MIIIITPLSKTEAICATPPSLVPCIVDIISIIMLIERHRKLGQL